MKTLNFKTLAISYVCIITMLIFPLNGFSQHPAPVASPAVIQTLEQSFLYFQVTISSGVVNLKWGTERHSCGELISVERSGNGIDFEQVGSIEINADINTEQDYSMIDSIPYEGQNNYRLKQLSPDGHYIYSDQLSINYTENRFENIELFPVPARDQLNIRLNSPQSDGFFVDIFNSAEQFITQYYVMDPQQPITLDLSSLPVGYFYARISDGTSQVKKKLVKVN